VNDPFHRKEHPEFVDWRYRRKKHQIRPNSQNSNSNYVGLFKQ
jgi:hypothetical protein